MPRTKGVTHTDDCDCWMCVEIRAWNSAVVPSSEGIEHPFQSQPRDPAELIRDDRPLGRLVVS